jgi:N-acetylglutamate synthase-like GNAT family acetyltransferase
VENPALTNIRAARPDDIDPLAALLARAFAADPVFDWCLRPWSRRRAAEQFFAPLIADAIPHGGVRVDDGETACAVWLPPGVPDSGGGVWAAWKNYLWMLRVASPLRVSRLKSVICLSEEVHLPEPCYHLLFIGSLPDARGSGRAAALLKDMLAAADKAGMPAFLETADATNIGYYERFGFNVTGQAQLPRGGPTINLMWRGTRPD